MPRLSLCAVLEHAWRELPPDDKATFCKNAVDSSSFAHALRALISSCLKDHVVKDFANRLYTKLLGKTKDELATLLKAQRYEEINDLVRPAPPHASVHAWRSHTARA